MCKYRYDKEKEVALTKWEQLLIEILQAVPEADAPLLLSRASSLKCDMTEPFYQVSSLILQNK